MCTRLGTHRHRQNGYSGGEKYQVTVTAAVSLIYLRIANCRFAPRGRAPLLFLISFFTGQRSFSPLCKRFRSSFAQLTLWQSQPRCRRSWSLTRHKRCSKIPTITSCVECEKSVCLVCIRLRFGLASERWAVYGLRLTSRWMFKCSFLFSLSPPRTFYNRPIPVFKHVAMSLSVDNVVVMMSHELKGDTARSTGTLTLLLLMFTSPPRINPDSVGNA